MKTRCLIIDDEPLAIKLIKTHLSKLDSFEVAGECSNALKAVEFLKRGHIDLMFLDINMPEITGLDFLKSLPDPPYVIITTAYREYAIEGYDLDVIDFLLKPISFERFLKAINRYCNRSNPFHKNSAGQPQSAENRHVFIQDGKNIYKVSYDDLLYLEGFGEYVKVVTVSKTYLVRDSLLDFEQKLSGDHFLRIHKSYIVNLEKITGYSSVHIMLKNNELPIGRIFRERVMTILKKGSSG
ncbi:MAG TPA: DNA-binding response regulator [Bacteroidales bacterium]|jgi:DNA-binding LytR/AlgR family response regulator|nr:DNA-binding response regulator [Bacteroidales bacterium]